jgi:NodT family efflux transporter outer membrane factor (OMF) lipoprotein
MNTHPTLPLVPGLARAAAFAVAALLASCTVGPDYEEPQVAAPESFGEMPTQDPATGAGNPSVATDRPLDLAAWWTSFQDPVLDDLVQRAIDANPTLRQAEARVREARARRGIAESALWPDLDATASAIRSHSSGNTSATTPGSSFVPGREITLWQAGFDASWEIDLFGGTRREIEATDAELAAGIEDRRDVLVSLLAEVARDYVELRGSQRQAAIARANLQSQQETLDLTRARLRAGLVSDLDVARAEALVRATESRLPELDSVSRQAIHRLAVLLAQTPASLLPDLLPAAPIPIAPPLVAVGLPSELLRRRPDVRRAERVLAAATARIGVAVADRFPKFTFDAAYGVSAKETSMLDENDSRYWSFGPSLTLPLLDFGRRSGEVEVRNAIEEQAAAAWEQTVLGSLREVEDALVAFSREQTRRTSLAGAVDSNRRAVDLATVLYERGNADFLSVLDAQRALFATEDALAGSDSTVASDLIALYKALGGGWEIEADAGPFPRRGEPGERSLDLTAPPATAQAPETAAAPGATN